VGDFCPTIAPRHQEIHSCRIARGWLGSSTDVVRAGPNLFSGTHVRDPCGFKWYSCGTHTYSLWDPQFYWVGFMIKKLCFPHSVSGKDLQSGYYLGNFTKTLLNFAEIVFYSKHLFGFIKRTRVEGIFATPLSHTIKKRRVVWSLMDGSDHPWGSAVKTPLVRCRN
jgi:hypothetical protein